jgi:lipoate-protein ligase A
MDARLIFDEPARGSWNMAVDEALLRTSSDMESEVTGKVVLRFYQWAEPTLSLGYFQASGDRALHEPTRGLPVVRRSTGGGAIVHDHELTYSFVHPIQDRFSDESQSFVRRIHSALISALSNVFGPKSPEPFLCFARRSKLDILLDRHKIAGSAQRRHQRAMLQHGSILLSKSAHAATLPGVNDLSGKALTGREVADALARQVEADFPLRLVDSQLAAVETAAAAEIERERFANQDWTRRR